MHVRKRGDGYRWIVQHGGRKQTGTAPTRPAAVLAASQARIDLGGQLTTTHHSTIEDLLTAWQAERQETWSPTYATDVELVCSRLPDAFLNRDIRTVTPPIIKALHRTLTKQGWSPHRVRRAHDAISAAYKLAVGYGWAATNPCRDLVGPHIEPAQVSPPPDDVVRAILAAAPPKLGLVIRLAIITGARLGELVALRWSDLDGDTLTIRRAVINTPKTGTVVRDKTKTGRKGDRRLVLDPETIGLLSQRYVDDIGAAHRHVLPPPVYVFSHDAGVTPWRPQYVGLEYRRLRRKVPGAERVRFHDLRHYVATSMLADGEALIDVAAQLGHSTPTTTARVYAHYLPGRGRDSAIKRASRLSSEPAS